MPCSVRWHLPLVLAAGLAACSGPVLDPTEPGPYTYGRGAFAEPTTASEITLADGGKGFELTCRATTIGCRRRAEDLCPKGYARINPALDGPGPDLAASVSVSSLKQTGFVVRCAGG